MSCGCSTFWVMEKGRSCLRRGNSLVEVLVVVAIVILLLALLLPSLSGSREQARRVQCANNLRQWGVALQMYRDEHDDFIPAEGTYFNVEKPYNWFDVLPPYLSAPPYKNVEGANASIKEFPNNHVWICPSKNLTDLYKSDTGKNQFHYGMNQVLDGMGSPENPSADTPDFPDKDSVANAGRRDEKGGRETPLRAALFARHPQTVFLFDIAPNSPGGSPRVVANEKWRQWDGKRPAKFHGDFANVLYLNGGVTYCTSADLYDNEDNLHGRILWRHPKLYWGYPPPRH